MSDRDDVSPWPACEDPADSMTIVVGPNDKFNSITFWSPHIWDALLGAIARMVRRCRCTSGQLSAIWWW